MVVVTLGKGPSVVVVTSYEGPMMVGSYVNYTSQITLSNTTPSDNPTSQIILSKRCDNVTFSFLQRKDITF
jgi:hypothetical protein